MGQKRKDNKGRVLKTGESQRKDGLYQYRYTDSNSKRHTIYDSDLKRLRDKEFEIEQNMRNGIDASSSNLTVNELLQQYIDTNQAIRYSTRNVYTRIIKTLSADPISHKKIKDIKPIDGKQLAIRLYAKYKYNTINGIFRFMKAAFKTAVENDYIVKNPFCFAVSSVIMNTTEHRNALTDVQQKEWLDFIQSNTAFRKTYDLYVVLLETGMRVSEFCGLTDSNIDFHRRRIMVDHQLLQKPNGEYYIERTKTKSGTRVIPMTQNVYDSLHRIIELRRDTSQQFIIDGYTGFILINQYGNPRAARNISYSFARAYKKYRTQYPDSDMPTITPHLLRHTFCSNMIKHGMNIKALQYLMGHSSSAITLDVYAHIDYNMVEKQVQMIDSVQNYA